MNTGRDIFWDANFCPDCKKHWVHCYCNSDKAAEYFEKREEVTKDERQDPTNIPKDDQ